MKKILILFCLCSCNFTDADHWDVDQGLKSTVMQFYTEASRRGVYIQHSNMQMGLGHLEVPAVGRTYGVDPPTIVIDEVFFDRLNFPRDSLILQYVVFHELGHALLGRDHVDSHSIMTANGRYQFEYIEGKEKRTELIDELFRK